MRIYVIFNEKAEPVSWTTKKPIDLKKGWVYVPYTPTNEVINTDPYILKFNKVLGKLLTIFEKKHHDYGPNNIGQFGELGVLIRANDKMERLKQLIKKEAKNEALEDTWLDLAIYAVIGYMNRTGQWNDQKP